MSASAVSRLLILFLAIALAACTAEAEPSEPRGGQHPATLAGSAWRVISVAGQLPAVDAPPTIAFTATSISGSAGCNEFGGFYQYDAATGRLALTNLAMTAMACADNRRMVIETAFSQALGVADLATLDQAGHLVLSGPGGQIVLANGHQAAG